MEVDGAGFAEPERDRGEADFPDGSFPAVAVVASSDEFGLSVGDCHLICLNVDYGSVVDPDEVEDDLFDLLFGGLAWHGGPWSEMVADLDMGVGVAEDDDVGYALFLEGAGELVD